MGGVPDAKIFTDRVLLPFASVSAAGRLLSDVSTFHTLSLFKFLTPDGKISTNLRIVLKDNTPHGSKFAVAFRQFKGEGRLVFPLELCNKFWEGTSIFLDDIVYLLVRL
mmetsp:Transcript_56448/g.163715  ORF Transcript_56448/g.163715 Transcript_56448/m.163715 type:complete len:109 (-) Transcript_56448:296-622(-)